MVACKATVSVVIPCYNGDKYLRETLMSVLTQTHPPHEVLVIDDGSTDGSAATAESFGLPVRVLRQSNQGESIARNRGIDEAKGEWIAFLDADDLWLPNKLERQLAIVSNTSQAVCSGYATWIPGGSGDGFQCGNIHVPQRDELELERLWRHGNPTHLSTLIVRKHLPNRFPTWTCFAEDSLYLYDLLLNGTIDVVPDVLCYYRKANGSQSSRADIECLWFQSKNEWLHRNQQYFNSGQLAMYRQYASESLLESAKRAVYHRDWNALYIIKSAVSSWLDFPYRQQVLALPKYPKHFYQVNDWLRRRMRGQ